VRDNIEQIMNTMGLAELTWSSEGKYKLLLEHPTTESEQNALVASEHYFDDDSIIRESISLSWPSAESRLNQATVNFLNEHEDFKEDTATWPTSLSSIHNAYLAEDNNQPFQSDLNMSGITDPYHALAKAEESVRKARTMVVLNLVVSKKGLNLEPGDFINVTSTIIAITNEVYRVESIEVRSDFSVKLKCYSFDFNVLAWNIDDDVAYTVAPVFDFIISPPSSVAFSEGTTDVLGFSSGQLSWQHADDVSATDYLVEISADNGSTYQSLGVTRANTFDIVGLQTGVYTFSVRSRTPSGTLSERVLNTGNTIQLKTVGSVAIVYADTSDETSNTQSYTAGSNTFVAYYAHNGETPILPITTEIEFKLFIGENGNQTKTVYLFSNGVNPPSAPAGNDGYNISTGSAEASSPWTLNSTSPSPDQTIYQASALLTQLNGVGNWAALAGW